MGQEEQRTGNESEKKYEREQLGILAWWAHGGLVVWWAGELYGGLVVGKF